MKNFLLIISITIFLSSCALVSHLVKYPLRYNDNILHVGQTSNSKKLALGNQQGRIIVNNVSTLALILLSMGWPMCLVLWVLESPFKVSKKRLYGTIKLPRKNTNPIKK